MTDWARVCADGFAVPSDRPLADLVAELSAMLRVGGHRNLPTRGHHVATTVMTEG